MQKNLINRIADLEAANPPATPVLPWSPEQRAAAWQYVVHGIEPAAPIDPALLAIARAAQAV